MRRARQIGTIQSNGRVSQFHRHIKTAKRFHIANGINRMSPSRMDHNTTRSKHTAGRGNVHDMTLHHEVLFSGTSCDFLQEQNIPPELTAEIGQESTPRIRGETTEIPRNNPKRVQGARRIIRHTCKERRRPLARGWPRALQATRKSWRTRCCSRS